MKTRIALVLPLLLVVGACSSDGLEPTTVEVRAVDYGFEGLPERVAAGSTFTVVNESSAELHEVVAIKLPEGETRTADELVQLPPQELAAFFPLVESVIIAPPESDGFVVEGTGTLSEPGRYLIICAIPTGADPDEYMAAVAEAEGGPPRWQVVRRTWRWACTAKSLSRGKQLERVDAPHGAHGGTGVGTAVALRSRL